MYIPSLIDLNAQWTPDRLMHALRWHSLRHIVAIIIAYCCSPIQDADKKTFIT